MLDNKLKHKTLIIAEAGVNHNGDLSMAKKLIDIAVECKADIVKFQTGKLNALVTRNAPMADYQKRNIQKEESQIEMLKKITLKYDDFIILSDYCNERGIEFLSTPFDVDSIHFLSNLVRMWKIPSGEVTNYPYLREIGKTKKKVIMSTGMCEVSEIEDAIRVLRKYGTEDITLLQCTTEYPAPIDEVNLNVMKELENKFNCNVGLSDHTEGIEISLAAVAMGACVIEKHFTIDKSLPGPDHKASASPDELKKLVNGIMKIETAMGSSQKTVGECEEKNKAIARKSIVASRPIHKGDIYSEENITTKRPGTGVSPMRWNEVIGKKANKDYVMDDLIEL